MSWQWTRCSCSRQPPGNLPDPDWGLCPCHSSFHHWIFHKVAVSCTFSFLSSYITHYRYHLRRVRKSSLGEKTVLPGLKDLLSWLSLFSFSYNTQIQVFYIKYFLLLRDYWCWSNSMWALTSVKRIVSRIIRKSKWGFSPCTMYKGNSENYKDI